MIAVPAVISLLLIGSVTEVTTVTMAGLLAVFLAFTAFRYRRQESSRYHEMAQNLTAIVDRFKPIMEGTSEIAIKNIALDLLKDERVAESLGNGVAGWRAFFDQYAGQASETYNHVEFGLSSFVREPHSKKELQGLIRDFKGALSDHYLL